MDVRVNDWPEFPFVADGKEIQQKIKMKANNEMIKRATRMLFTANTLLSVVFPVFLRLFESEHASRTGALV